MEKGHLDIRIIGLVQGVWYRKSACEQALGLGIAGFVMNLPDGTVRIEAEGTHEALDQLVAWCRVGSSRAVVEHVEMVEGPFVGYTGFEARR